MRIGVLDIGSTTVHLLVVDARPGGAPRPLVSVKHELLLAASIDADGFIPDSAVDQLVACLDECRREAFHHGVADIVAFATSAVRDARNGLAVAECAQAALGHTVCFLSGEQEAALTYYAARRWWGLGAGRIRLVDIGGGSVEFAVGDGELADAVASVPLGAGRITREEFSVIPPDPDSWSRASHRARRDIAAHAEALGGEPAQVNVATSKTFRILARLERDWLHQSRQSPEDRSDRRNRSDALRVTRSGVGEVVRRLRVMDVDAVSQLPGVSARRARQILGGATVAEAAMDVLVVPELDVCPWALREGVILSYFDTLRVQIPSGDGRLPWPVTVTPSGSVPSAEPLVGGWVLPTG